MFALRSYLFVVGLNGLCASFTSNPPTAGTDCAGGNRQLDWVYTTSNSPLAVQWKKDGSSFLDWDVGANILQHFIFNSSQVSHDNSNGQITLKDMDSSFSGIYTCEMTDISGTFVSDAHNLLVYDLVTSGMSCSCETEKVDCNLPSTISLVTVNGTQVTLPYTPNITGSYNICMAGDQSNCLANDVDRCETVDLCPLGTSVIPTTSTNATTTRVSNDCTFGEHIPCNLLYILVGVGFIGVMVILYCVYRNCCKGHDSTTQEPLSTEQSQVDVSTSFIDSPYSSTKHSGKENTETTPIISTDLYITTSNTSTVPENQNLLIHIMIPVVLGSVFLVVIACVIVCYVTCKRLANSKESSGIYTDPETISHEKHVNEGMSATNPEHGQIKNTETSSLQSSLNHNGFSPKLFHDENRYTRRNLQHDRYDKNFNNDNRVDRRLHPIEMEYLPRGYYRNEHYAFGPQTSRSAVLNDYYYDNQRRKMMHQRDHKFNSNFSFYRG